jgi:hypothetical protein
LYEQCSSAVDYRSDTSFSQSMVETYKGESFDSEDELLAFLQIVDNVLFRKYLELYVSLLGSLFRVKNYCSEIFITNWLSRKAQRDLLVEFYHGKRWYLFHSKGKLAFFLRKIFPPHDIDLLEEKTVILGTVIDIILLWISFLQMFFIYSLSLYILTRVKKKDLKKSLYLL